MPAGSGEGREQAGLEAAAHRGVHPARVDAQGVLQAPGDPPLQSPHTLVSKTLSLIFCSPESTMGGVHTKPCILAPKHAGFCSQRTS